MVEPSQAHLMSDVGLLRQTFEKISPLGNTGWAVLIPQLVTRNIQPGEQLLRAGGEASFVFFVCGGLLREYYIDRTGKEYTRRFCEAADFSGSLSDLLCGERALVSIEALENSRILQIPWKFLDSLTAVHPEWMMLARRFAELLYIRKMRREYELLTLSGAELYAQFKRDFPALDARLPLHLVASYLGITPVHLSRLRSAGKSWRSKPAR